MPVKKKKRPFDDLVAIAIEALSDKKAINPVLMDFKELKGALCDSFLICHGNSRVQVEAITDHLTAEIKRKTGLAPAHIEGMENAEWVLIDYFDLVIHVFQETRRKFYNIEQLWADANVTMIETTD
jgi:ribosome-associated protein